MHWFIAVSYYGKIRGEWIGEIEIAYGFKLGIGKPIPVVSAYKWAASVPLSFRE